MLKRFLLALVLVGLAGFGLVSAVKRLYYVHATSANQSVFFRVFDLKPQVDGFIRRRCFSWSSDGWQDGWRGASHFRGFHENVVIPSKDWPLVMTNLDQILSGQLSLNGTHILRRVGDIEKGFGFDYREGNTLGTVMVQPLPVMGASCFNCAPVSSDEVALRLDVSIKETWYNAKPTEAAVQQFLADRAFESLASKEEDSFLTSSLPDASKSHEVGCASAIRARLLEKGITVSPDPKDETQLVVNYPEDYFRRK